MSKHQNVGIVGVGMYLPEGVMTAREISAATNGQWSEDAVREKLGIYEKRVPSAQPCDGTQEMGALAALDCLKSTSVDPLEIDAILCFGEEWKEYPLTTSACYIQDRIGAANAWCVDIQNRCCSTVTAMKMAKDMMLGSDDCSMVLICGGYRNLDFIDYTDNNVSFMFDLAAGGGAILLKKNHGKNLLLGSHIISDGSIARTVGGAVGGTAAPVTPENLREFGMLRLMDAKKMKERLGAVSMDNWMKCIEKSFEQAQLPMNALDFLAVLHMKRSGHMDLLQRLGLTEQQSIYLENYGHVGQVDQILALKLALESGQVRDGSVVCMLAAGIGYVWAANVIRWGECT